MGFVPTLVVDGMTLTDSIAIMEYLEETKPGPALLPTEPVLRAKVCYEWTSDYMWTV